MARLNPFIERAVEHAEEVLYIDEKAAQYGLSEVYLVFDCDAPEDIQEAIQDMKQSHPRGLLGRL